MLARLSIRVKFQKSDLFEVGVIRCGYPNPLWLPQSVVVTPIRCGYPNPLWLPQSVVVTPIPRANPNPTRKPQSVAPAPNGYFISLELPNH